MKIFIKLALVIVACVSVAALTFAQNAGLLGGANTVFDDTEAAFTNHLPGFSAEQIADFEAGDELFEEEFVARTGLGPIYNNVSCESCHIEDGRGRPPAFTGETETGFLIRLATTAINPDGSTVPDPIYGGQFQDESVAGVPEEGTIQITYTPIHGFYADGTPYTLYAPNYQLIDLNYGALDPTTTFSPRLAQQMIGLGMLEAIPEATLLAFADPNDSNGDGISGRPNYVWDAVAGQLAIGRFGWKANQPNLFQQSLGAFNGDMGITSSLNPDESCTIFQFECLAFSAGDGNGRDNRNGNPRGQNGRGNGSGDNNRPPCPDNARPCRDGRPPNGRNGNGGNNGNGGRRNVNNVVTNDINQPEISDEEAELVIFYSSSLAVPAQRNPDDPQVIQGQMLFMQANCSGCHLPQVQTGTHPTIPQLSNQTISPYTDLLLHDMGAGLADNQTDFLASGQEWRTPPLWGIGLLEEVNGYAFFMHDGRARTLEEAILWHGGEAQASRDVFVGMSADERAALIAFLQSL